MKHASAELSRLALRAWERGEKVKARRYAGRVNDRDLLKCIQREYGEEPTPAQRMAETLKEEPNR